MRKFFYPSLLLLLLGALALAAWHSASPAAAQVNREALGATVYTQPETWNLGITVEGAPTYNAVIGRLVSDVGVFRSARADQGATIFPAPATSRNVQGASFYLLSRTGSYTGTAKLSLVIFNYAGVVQHTVSAADVGLQAAPIGTWTPVTLSGTADNLVISPGEFLAFRDALSAGAAENLDVRLLYEVLVR